MSVWSPPECLENLLNVLDPTPEMDIYSFGMILFELFHMEVPFEGSLDKAINKVLVERGRPIL